MKTLDQIQRVLRTQLPRLQEEFQVETLGIFGSYVRREALPDSDLDLLVSFRRPIGLLRFMALEERLSDLVGVPVDLVTRKALKPRLGQRILGEVSYL